MSRNAAREYAQRCERVEAAIRETGKQEATQVRAVCPDCASSKTGRPDYSLHVSPAGWFWCFRCGLKGRLRGYDESAESVEREAAPTVELPEGFLRLGEEPGSSALVLEPARSYLVQRQLSPAAWRQFGIGAVLDGYYGGRVVVPVGLQPGAKVPRSDERAQGDPTGVSGVEGAYTGVLTGWVARDWTGRAAKPYLYPRGMDRAWMYLHHALDVVTDEPVLAVEGVFDAMAHAGEDSNGAVAFLGKPTDAQIAALRATVRPVVLVLDGDAHEEAWALCARLRFDGQRAGTVRLPPRVDPDEVPHAWLIEEARRAVEASL